MPVLSAIFGRFLLFVSLVVAGMAQSVCAAVQLEAPEAVRTLLRSLALADADVEVQDETARATLGRRLGNEAGEILATEGYFSPQIELRTSNSGLVLQVAPGPLAHIGSVDIEIRGALSVERRQKLIRDWTLPSAEVFRQSAWDNAKQGLLSELMAVDHAGARLLSSQAEVDVANERVDLHLVYDAGPRYRYGEIRLLGLKRYSEALAERYTEKLEPGAAYRQEDLLAVQTALQNTPYFSSVSIELEFDPLVTAGSETAIADKTDNAIPVPVNIRLRERAPFNVGLGVGVSSNTGARVEGNFRNADLFGRGWELNTGARIEQLQQTVYADVFFPPDLERNRDSVGTVVQQSDIQGLGIKGWALAASRVQLRGSIEQRYGLNWQYEEQTPNDEPTTTNRALAATIGWVWRHADDPLDAAEGIVAQLQLGGATKALLSDQNFLRTYFRYSQGIPLGKSDALLLRGELGATLAKSSQGIPQDYLFRAGGSNSVRGYAYQSLGVQEGTATLGGRYLLTLSAEYTHWIDAQWGVATFVDAGNAADDREVLTLALGYGLGARWKSPAGPLAVDLAWGQRDQQLRVHFSLAVPF